MKFLTDLKQQYHAVYEEQLLNLKQRDPLLAHLVEQYKYQLFLSNPSLAFAKNGLYVCGLKPYGKKGESYEIPEILPENYHAYLDETWHTPYVIRALDIIKLVQTQILKTSYEPRQVLVANWFFQRAEDARQLKKMGCEVSQQIPFQQQILAHYQPRVVLCIGNGNLYSAYAGMCALHRKDPKETSTASYLERSQLKYFQTPTALIIGIPHLSRYPVTEKITEFIQQFS